MSYVSGPPYLEFGRETKSRIPRSSGIGDEGVYLLQVERFGDCVPFSTMGHLLGRKDLKGVRSQRGPGGPGSGFISPTGSPQRLKLHIS